MAESGASSTVVFLGPSLPLGAARALLDADYRGPARFGDIYGLVGGGTRVVVLVDGVFHGHAPVWQREILCALESGITVIGAGSMGALRAAEMAPHGMIGLGSVFQAFAGGELDGDDEVALLHEGPERGYRALSVPLVNLRFTLDAAVGRGLLDAAQAAALVGAMKALPFWERTMPAAWNTPICASLPEPRRAELRAFFAACAVDVKQADAASALAEVARLRGAPRPPSARSAAAPSYHDRHRLLCRGIPVPGLPGCDGRRITSGLLSDRGRHRALRSVLAARFFVLEWARGAGIRVPEGERPALEAAHRRRAGASRMDAWLRDNRLTEPEHRDLLEDHLLWRWLLARDPSLSGVEHRLSEEASAAAALESESCEPFERADLARSLPYVAAYCQSNGVSPGEAAAREAGGPWAAALSAPLRDALWAVEQGPVHLGYTTWSLSTSLLGELQITGAIGRRAGERP